MIFTATASEMISSMGIKGFTDMMVEGGSRGWHRLPCKTMTQATKAARGALGCLEQGGASPVGARGPV